MSSATSPRTWPTPPSPTASGSAEICCRCCAAGAPPSCATSSWRTSAASFSPGRSPAWRAWTRCWKAATFPSCSASYERELHGVVEAIVATPYDTVVNVGCAEGYYAVGLARRMPQARFHTFDTNEAAQAACLRLAQINGVAERMAIAGTLTGEDSPPSPGGAPSWSATSRGPRTRCSIRWPIRRWPAWTCWSNATTASRRGWRRRSPPGLRRPTGSSGMSRASSPSISRRRSPACRSSTVSWRSGSGAQGPTPWLFMVSAGR